ncbi:MAG: hypothetical protein KatS3mg051_2134 [Anaerolineae bacterium]|nr:MAG: hypothetical protein KatS3mg051_2134 [Anaerolineae bacterium]
MRILLYCPLAPQTPRIYARTVESLFRMQWDGPLPMVFGRCDAPRGTKYQDLCAKHNEARTMVLDGGYDAVLFVENDMVVPPDTLERLCAVDADVAYGLYVSRHGWNRWLAFHSIHGYGGVSYSQDPERMRAVWGTVSETLGVGMGCTLIHRHVLERIGFRTAPDDVVADDWMFALDCIDQGFRQAHDFGVVCGHITPDGKILWPAPEAPGSYRIEFMGPRHVVRATRDDPLTVPVGMGTVVVEGYVEE